MSFVLGVDESFDDSSVHFLALYVQAQTDIPLLLLPLVNFSSFGSLSSSTGLLVESMTMFNSLCSFIVLSPSYDNAQTWKTTLFYYVVIDEKC